MASGPFWDTVTPSQNINNVRKYAARDAPVKLQGGAVKQGFRVDHTLLVVDLAPPPLLQGFLTCRSCASRSVLLVAPLLCQ